jgi:hypothetical protein
MTMGWPLRYASRMNAQLFIATTGKGISRAELYGDTWQTESLLPDQDVRCLAADPLNPAIIYAGTQGNGVLCSTDRGKRWQPAGLAGCMVKSLAVSPHEPGTLYAGTKPSAVFVSRDSGSHWTELEAFQRIRFRWLWRSPAEPPDWRAYVMGLTISPADPNVLVAGIEFGALVRSSDGGRTWSNHRKGALRDCHSLTFHACNGNWVYEGGGGGAAVSRDGGLTWRQPKAGLDRRYGWACAADPQRPEVWYISASPMFSGGLSFEPPAHVDGKANAAIYRSAGGAAWEKLGGGLPEPLHYMAYALLTDAQAPGHLYAGLSDGDIWHSADYGDSWQKVPLNLGAIGKLLLL